MAQQKFNNNFREALWETYGKECFHCTRELLLADMRVDHIIPEHLYHGEAAKLAAVRADIGLPDDFNILGSENLAPSCEGCNGEKSGSILIGRAADIKLTRIQRKLPALERNLRKKRKARDLEDVLLAVAHSIESGKFTMEEFGEQFIAIFHSYPDMSATFRTVAQLRKTKKKKKKELQQLNRLLAKIYTRPVRLGREDPTRYQDLLRSEPSHISFSGVAPAFSAMWTGLILDQIKAEKMPDHQNRYVVKGLRRLMGLDDDADITFDVRDDIATLVDPQPD